MEPPEILRLRFSLRIRAQLLNALRDGSEPLIEEVSRAVLCDLEQLRQDLGVPGSVQLDVEALEETPKAASSWLTLSVNGRVCAYPQIALRFVFESVFRDEEDLAAGTEGVFSRLEEAISSPFDKQRARAVKFFAQLCVDIVLCRPSLLLGVEAMRPYQDASASLPPTEVLLPALRQLLDLRLSIADTPRMLNALRKKADRSLLVLVEDLVEELLPGVLEVRLTQHYLRQLRHVDPEFEEHQFRILRHSIFDELGLLFPVIRVTIDDRLEDGCFAFKLNHVVATPLRGLEPTEMLVNDTQDRLTHYRARPALNPASWEPAAIVSLSYRAELESAGLTTWNACEYLVSSLASSLRELGRLLVHRPLVEYRLNRLAETTPVLVEHVRRRFSLEQLTYVLRALSAEQVSTRDLKVICERLLDVDFTAFDSSRFSPLNDRATNPEIALRDTELPDASPEALVRFVRAGLSRQITHDLTRGAETLVAYLLDDPFERLLADAAMGDFSDATRERVLDAIRAELAMLPRTAALPCVLTLPRVRAVLREMTQTALPHLAIVSYADLSANTNVQPVGRIALATQESLS